MSGYPDSTKGYDMELFNLEVSKWGISLTTYFGDVYLFWRTFYLVIGVVIVLRVAKYIRKRVK
jgi:hypothetical protein